MTTPTPHVKFTYEDYLLFPDNGRRHELLDGEHVMTPAPIPRHQRILTKLLLAFETCLTTHPAGTVLPAPCDVILSPYDVVQPDLLFISTLRAALITERNIQGAPDLVVEILSDTTRKTDEIIKRKLYERFWVREYWIVDPVIETVTVYRLTQDAYTRVAILSAEQQECLTTPFLPAFSVSLPSLFRN